MSGTRAGPEPTARVPAARSEEELTVAFAAAVSRRYRELGDGARRGTPEAVAFGMLSADLRTREGLDRARLAERSRLNPVYLAMLEKGLLGPDEIPPVVVARLAVALGRRLSELPLTPYEVDAEPVDEVEVTDGATRLRLGLDTWEPWVAAMVAAATAAPTPLALWLPDFDLWGRGRGWRARDVHLTDAPAPVPRSDDYGWHVLLGRGHRAGERWSIFGRVTEAGSDRPAAGVEVELRAGAQRQAAVTDERGGVAFERLDPADLEPLRFAVV